MENIKPKFLAQFVAGTLGGTLLGITGFVILLTYGGNYGCWEFVNKLLNSVGYESCGPFGAIGGLVLGIILGIFIISKLRITNYARTSGFLVIALLLPILFGVVMYWPPFEDQDMLLVIQVTLGFIFVSAIISLILTTIINWRKIFKRK